MFPTPVFKLARKKTLENKNHYAKKNHYVNAPYQPIFLVPPNFFSTAQFLVTLARGQRAVGGGR